MAEEFQESEVIFSDQNTRSPNLYFNYQETAGTHSNSRMFNNSKKKRSKRNKKNHSAPINIPENIFHSADSGDDYFDDEFDDEVPPHVILSRRIAGKMEFSVCAGIGRTLKGRDLSEVRNSILRMTGFLET